ncbi:MAG: 50S ribosomal protein L32 [Chitinispirillales bacterium]|jgi:large subunit ribosomal protein L32|nr:50S ribosomal protein L32 [Chitinispirillales bacterium]
MAVPKRRVSSSRRDMRRSHHALNAVAPGVCSHCKQPKLSHRICPSCGYYNGKEALSIKED